MIGPNKREIGSEFHQRIQEDGDGLNLSDSVEWIYVFSGRTAIETVLKNILQYRTVNKVVLPSYCCESMLQPFKKANIIIEFYDVYYDDGFKITPFVSDDTTILIWCNYFGFRFPMADFSAFKENGGIIIEDITHSLLSEQPYHDQSDYLVASIRKWEPVLCGGLCADIKGSFFYYPTKTPPQSFINKKHKAMAMKTEYLIKHEALMKEKYLALFNSSNEWLSNNYMDLGIDSESRRYIESADIIRQKNKRINNARILYQGLRKMSTIKTLFPEEQMDCPLFVPVIIAEGKRDKVRKTLIKNEIYCPVHWPHPQASCNSNLYNIELSLICDQRYSTIDMYRILDVLSICE